MADFDPRANEAMWVQARAIVPAIRLGDAERRVILAARRDLNARRSGRPLVDDRLDALRRYAMVQDRSCASAALLTSAGFSAAERRIVDAMVDAIPYRAETARPVAGRLIFAALILLPLLAAVGGYSWANAYLQDRLVAVVAGGLALLMVMPLASTMLAPMPRNRSRFG